MASGYCGMASGHCGMASSPLKFSRHPISSLDHTWKNVAFSHLNKGIPIGALMLIPQSHQHGEIFHQRVHRSIKTSILKLRKFQQKFIHFTKDERKTFLRLYLVHWPIPVIAPSFPHSIQANKFPKMNDKVW
jgi:hypothetical protein